VSEHPYYNQEVHGPYELFDLENFPLEEGGTLRGCQLAYATVGELSAARDNAILLLPWYAGTSKRLGQAYVGPGRALDPARYFIILVNQLGSGLSTSPHNTPAPFGGARFPRVGIGDDVRAEERLVRERFGLEQLELVVGASMGAQQTYEWAVRFPDMVKRAAPIAGTAKTTPHDFLYVETFSEAIRSDPAWRGGWYASGEEVHLGLRRHARVWGLMGFSSEFYKQEVWRGLGFSSLEDFLVGLLEGAFLPNDSNNLLCQAWKWQQGDVSRHSDGDLAAALGRVKAKTFVLPVDEDMVIRTRDCEAEQRLIPGSELRVINSLWGHLALLGLDSSYTEQVDRHLGELLDTNV
jgi:homoserine O-acetyltransferase/O-succinyltransferase